MSRLTRRKEDGKAYILLYSDPNRLGAVMQEQIKKQDAVIEKLAHYEDLEEQGRLIELPCKVGDTVYGIDLDFMYIVSFKVLEIFITEDGIQFGNEYEGCSCKAEQFGTQVFLTKEEAEARLKELAK